MQTHFDTAKDKILNQGYYIQREEFTDGAIIFSIVKQESENTKSIHAEIAYNIAKLLVRETGKPIVNKEYKTVALNFIPIPVKPGCIRFI